MVWTSNGLIHSSFDGPPGCPYPSRLVVDVLLKNALSHFKYSVYALYQQNLKIGALLMAFLSLSIILSFTFCMRAFNALKFDSACNAQEPAFDVIYFGCVSKSFVVLRSSV